MGWDPYYLKEGMGGRVIIAHISERHNILKTTPTFIH